MGAWARGLVAVLAVVCLVGGVTAPTRAVELEGVGPPLTRVVARDVTVDDLPACTGQGTDAMGDPQRFPGRIVLDPRHGLPEDFRPRELVPVPVHGRHSDGQIRPELLPDLDAMHAAAAAADAPFEVVSGFRSGRHQAALYTQWLDELGPQPPPTDPATPLMVAPPGHSEHQLGTTIDVVDPSHIALDQAFATTPAGRWLARHAHEYGFVASYPRGQEALSCYGWEPWHLRWVGRSRAAAVHASGLPLRAWLLLHDEARG